MSAMSSLAPRTFVIVGGSRGLGAAACRHLAARGDRVVAVSRTAAVAGEWVEADVSKNETTVAEIDLHQRRPA
jgi:NAD(P)-dependent dehydrogenase (short-subunit alcohol dehydrogenase family)